jgi:Zn-dependent M28 family amino/carboxypeptidase
MLLKKIVLPFLILCLINIAGYTQNKALGKIDVDDLIRHLTFISSDSLQGRRFGTEIDGLGITADYLAKQAKEIGLKPVGDNFFQKVNLVASKPDEGRYIQIENKKSRLIYQSNSMVVITAGSKELVLKNEEVVLAGFGFTDKNSGFDDLKDVDIQGKIVVVAQGDPKSFKTGEHLRWNNRLERSKILRISEKKPRAIVIVTSPQDEDGSTFAQMSRYMNRQRYELEASKTKTDEVPVFVVKPEFADKLIGRKGKYKKYLNSIVAKKTSNSFLVKGKSINLKVGKIVEKIEAKNVIGIVEGSDAELKDEYMVFMAHYDHLGVAANGDVYNGADDNGSGTVTLLEVAEAFMSLEEKPKRSIVFLWVTAEEVGLLGSQYYSKNPILPLEKTVACINIDMDGRVYEPRDSVWNKSPKKVKDFDGLYTLSNDVWPDLKTINSEACRELGLIPDYSLPSNFLRSSDHYHFHKNGIPILNYATGYHADYHKVGDELAKINFEKMKRVAELCFLVGLEIANRDDIEIKK